ncbi:MAG: hypothetical protein O7C59_03375 [Rickettsia endosymbiont of Ixodes persulcatus]|nr:hypothetical protein [Rickettsia endosymbiont of Ixodes persulcatus]MCZ6913611.1 hypothetical protein [Rickettsia endosymbiont of Ixodes persulcatus]
MRIEESPVARAIEFSVDLKEEVLRLVVEKLVDFGRREVEARREKEKEEKIKQREIAAKVLRGNYDHLVIVRGEQESEDEYMHRMVRAMDEEWDRVMRWLMSNDTCSRCGHKKE